MVNQGQASQLFSLLDADMMMQDCAFEDAGRPRGFNVLFGIHGALGITALSFNATIVV